MIDGKFFRNKLVQHMEEYGYRDNLKRFGENSIDFLGIYLTFSVGEKSPNGERDLEIILEDSGEKSDNFLEHLEKMRTRDFQKENFPPNVRRKIKRYSQYLNIGDLENPQNGTYKLNAKLKTQNENRAFFALYNQFFRPLLVYVLK
tara:strand:+ start:320 stop:757 length:438 start_codon:yes stop_codon:yes gene_type:complete